jgi:hypothetical protein
MKVLFYSIIILVLTTISTLASTVTLAWNSSYNADGYKVYYRDTKTNQILNIDVGNTLQYPVANLVSRRKYEFWVSAYNSAGESSRSSKKAITTK